MSQSHDVYIDPMGPYYPSPHYGNWWEQPVPINPYPYTPSWQAVDPSWYYEIFKMLSAPPVKVWLEEGATKPTRGSKGAAGFDLYALRCYEVLPGHTAVISTGVHLAIPEGYVGECKDRSSLHKYGLETLAGVIDTDYRGDVGIVVLNFTQEPVYVQKGQRLAQMLIVPVLIVDWEEVDTVEKLGYTDRGNQGFGSTGK